jgi:hypothetical protein
MHKYSPDFYSLIAITTSIVTIKSDQVSRALELVADQTYNLLSDEEKDAFDKLTGMRSGSMNLGSALQLLADNFKEFESIISVKDATDD